MRFSIFQLLVTIGLCSVAICFTVDRWTVKYSIKDIEDAKKTNLQPDWTFVKHIGSEQGPFRRVGSFQFYGGATTRLNCSFEGESKLVVIPTNTFAEHSKIERFENKQGDSLILVSEYVEQ